MTFKNRVREAMACVFLLVVSVAILAQADEIVDSVAIASKAERLSIIGILIWIILLESACLIYIIRLLFMKGMKTFENVSLAVQELRDEIRQCHDRGERKEVY